MALSVFGDDSKYKNPLAPDWQKNKDVFEPEEVVNMDYIKEQIQYRHKLLLANNGETFQIWRKKQIGQRCDNPNCPASNDFRASANSDCPRCWGTRFVGGFDYKGETLIRYAPQTLQITIAPGGEIKAHNPFSWSLPDPEIFNFDIVLALDQPRLIHEFREVDKEYIIPLENPDFIPMNDGNIVNILKISNEANGDEDYKEEVDFVLTNDGILWLTGEGRRRPDIFAPFYVTYQKTAEYIRRYEISEVTKATWRGAILHQEMKINELETGHVAYRAIQIEPWDMTRHLYPFPYSAWYSRIAVPYTPYGYGFVPMDV